MNDMDNTTYLMMWFDDARIYLDGENVVVEHADRKFIAPIDAFRDVDELHRIEADREAREM